MRSWLNLIHFGLCFTFSVLMGTACGSSRSDDQSVLSWGIKQKVPSGRTREVILPESLRKASADQRVTIAQLADGRTCILLKKKIGWKDNFDASLCCSGPLKRREIIKDANQSPNYISLPGHGVFEELYIRRTRDDRTFDVYFDLN